MAWFKLKATSQVELSHLLFSIARRPCLKALRGKIRGFLICVWETYVCPSSQLQSVKRRWNQQRLCLCAFSVCFSILPGCTLIYLCMLIEITELSEGKEELWLLGEKLLKRLEPSTLNWSHFCFHVSSCPSPKWPITIISLLVVVMLVRQSERERRRERLRGNREQMRQRKLR